MAILGGTVIGDTTVIGRDPLAGSVAGQKK
jgi:hypothetical protein